MMNGIEPTRAARSTAGDNPRRNGFSANKWVVRVRRDEAV